MPFRGKSTTPIPRDVRESATANGMPPPPATMPTGEERLAADVMACGCPRLLLTIAGVGRQAKRAMLGFGNEGQNLRNRRIFRRHRLHGLQTLGKDAGAVKQLLIKRAHGGKALLGELPALHADDVEALEHGIMAVGEAERNDVAAHAANAADHHLRSDPRELVHGRQPADIDEVADLAVAAECGRGREDHVIADRAVMADMAVVHEKSAVADARQPTAFDRSDIHGDAFTNGAAIADLEPRRLALVAQILRRAAKRCERRNRAIGTDGGMPADGDMRGEHAAFADHGIAADHAIGTDGGAVANHGAVLNSRSRIDLHVSQSDSIAPTSASATTCPSTLASPWNHHIALRRPIRRKWYSTVSPGITGLRNLHLSTVRKYTARGLSVPGFERMPITPAVCAMASIIMTPG